MRMKWTVQRYVLREVVQTWLAVTGVLVAILVSNQLSRVLGQAADNQYGRHVVFDLIALGAIMNLSVIVPVGLLLAVVLTLGRLYHDSEMAALQACGFGPARLLAPLFCFAAVIAAGPGLAGVRASAARRPPGAAAAPIGDQRGAVRAARCRPIPLLQRRRCRVLCRTRRPGGRFAQRVRAARVGRDESRWRSPTPPPTPRPAPNGMHLVTLFNGRRYEGVPGRRRLSGHRVPRARHSHRHARGRRRHPGPRHQAHAASCSAPHDPVRHRATAIQGLYAAHGAGADPDCRAFEPPAAAAGPLCPRRLRHRGVLRLFESAVRRQGVAGEGRSAARDRRVVGALWRRWHWACTCCMREARTA